MHNMHNIYSKSISSCNKRKNLLKPESDWLPLLIFMGSSSCTEPKVQFYAILAVCQVQRCVLSFFSTVCDDWFFGQAMLRPATHHHFRSCGHWLGYGRCLRGSGRGQNRPGHLRRVVTGTGRWSLRCFRLGRCHQAKSCQTSYISVFLFFVLIFFDIFSHGPDDLSKHHPCVGVWGRCL